MDERLTYILAEVESKLNRLFLGADLRGLIISAYDLVHQLGHLVSRGGGAHPTLQGVHHATVVE